MRRSPVQLPEIGRDRNAEMVVGQTGIVCTIGHGLPHEGLAVERFFPDGPFARLPMTGNRC